MIKKESLQILIFCIIFHLVFTTYAAELDAGHKEFVNDYIEAINSKNLEKRKQLVHPACLDCITEENQFFYYNLFSVQFEDKITEKYGVSVQAYTPAEERYFAEQFYYPVLPTHLITIDYTIDRVAFKSRSIAIQVIENDGCYLEVIPCPKDSFIDRLKKIQDRRSRH